MNFEFDKANAEARAQRIRQESEAQQKAAQFTQTESKTEPVITEKAPEQKRRFRFHLRLRPQNA